MTVLVFCSRSVKIIDFTDFDVIDEIFLGCLNLSLAFQKQVLKGNSTIAPS